MIALLASGAANAQAGQPAGNSTASDDEASAEIVVTAQKRDQRLTDVPLSVTAISGQELQDKRIVDTRDLIRLVPGFSVTQTQFNNAPIYTLRGVGYFDSALAAGPAVSTYVDEIPLPYSAMTNGAFLDLANVQVLKGPQGTLFGMNSTGGAINFIAAKPRSSFEAGATLSYSRFDSVDLNGYVTGPINETVKARVALQLQRGNAWQQSTTRDDRLGSVRRLAGRALFDWEAAPDLKFELGFNGWIDTGDTQAPQNVAVVPLNPANLDPALANARIAPANDRAADWDSNQSFDRNDRFGQAYLRADWQLGESTTLTSLSAYSHLQTRSLIEGDGTPLQSLAIRSNGSISSVFQELRLAGMVGDQVHWLLGTNYGNDHVTDDERLFVADSTTSTTLGIKLSALDALGKQKIQTKAVFGNVDWTFLPNLTVQGGVRYTDTRHRFTGCSADTGDGQIATVLSLVQGFIRGALGLPPTANTPQAGQCVTLSANYEPVQIRNTLDEDNISWKVGLSWKPDPDALIYANVGRGYKSGSFPVLSATSYLQFEPAKQETLLAFEVGFHISRAGGRVTANGAIFYYDYSDKQIRGRIVDPVVGQLERIVNIPKSRVKGAEVDLTVEPLTGLRIRAAGSYIDSRIDRFTGISQTGATTNFAGTPFPFTPKWQVVGDIAYRWEVSPGLDAFVGADVTYHSSTNGSPGAEAISAIKPYTLIDLRVGVEDRGKRWRVSIFGTNITDKYYWVSAQRAQDTVIRYTGRPATYGATIGYNF